MLKQHRLRWLGLVAMVAILGLVAAACGSDEPTATPRPTQATPTPTPERPAWEIRWEATIAAAE